MNNLLWQSVLYLIFSFINWLGFVGSISICAFFHFQLDHNLKTIEDWILDYAWQLIVICKMIGIFVISRTLPVKVSFPNPFKTMLLRNLGEINKNSIVVSLFIPLYLYNVLVEKIGLGNLPGTIEIVESFVGLFVFYITDLMAICFIQKFYPLNSKISVLSRNIIFLTIFFIFNKSFLQGENSLSLYFFLMYFILLEFLSHNKYSLLNVIVIIVLGMCVSRFIFGINPLAQDDFTLLKGLNKMTTIHQIVIPSSILLYIYLSKYSFDFNFVKRTNVSKGI
ncbi:MAG: hypothetical protein H6622_17540 [Halobacteriovoraceae bacterium]|nr:hypothetical protein [Halobacteriovoraceae bacterium]